MQAGMYVGGFDELAAQNRQKWSEVWLGRMVLYGPTSSVHVEAAEAAVQLAKDQRMLDSVFYYLHSTAHPSAVTATPPYGLTQSGITYFGGAFWYHLRAEAACLSAPFGNRYVSMVAQKMLCTLQLWEINQTHFLTTGTWTPS
jgi:hypothetical protein